MYEWMCVVGNLLRLLYSFSFCYLLFSGLTNLSFFLSFIFSSYSASLLYPHYQLFQVFSSTLTVLCFVYKTDTDTERYRILKPVHADLFILTRIFHLKCLSKCFIICTQQRCFSRQEATTDTLFFFLSCHFYSLFFFFFFLFVLLHWWLTLQWTPDCIRTK